MKHFLKSSRQLRSGIPLRRITIYTILIAVLYFICWTPYWFDYPKIPKYPENHAQVFRSLCNLDECFRGWWSVRVNIGFVAFHHLLCPFASLFGFSYKLDSLRVFHDLLFDYFNFLVSWIPSSKCVSMTLPPQHWPPTFSQMTIPFWMSMAVGIMEITL